MGIYADRGISLNKLPSLYQTYKKSFSLFFKTYFEVVPFLILNALAVVLITRLMPDQPIDTTTLSLSNLDLGPYFLKLLISTAIHDLWFSIIFYLIYRRYTAEVKSTLQGIYVGVKRFPLVLIAGLLVIIPYLFEVVLIKHLNDTQSILMLLSLLFIAILQLILVIYTIVYVIRIVAKGDYPVTALMNSARAIRGHAWYTFALVMGYALIFVLFALGLNLAKVPYANIISLILFGSLYPSIIVVHYDNLERAAIAQADVKRIEP